MKRRSLLLGSAGFGAAGALWSPGGVAVPATGAGHDSYFAAMNAMLKAKGPGRPAMLIDLQRMNHNIDALSASVGKHKTYRVVVKSLPSVPLLEHIMKRANTNALMVFHQPFLNVIAQEFPQADVLLGKPMPVSAVRTFYAKLKPGRFDPARQIQWLVDSHERLLQYQSLARELGVKLRINFEIDVGLHRGGWVDPHDLNAALKVIAADAKHLSVAGLMGYEPQLTGMQATLEHATVKEVLSIYRSFIARLRAAGLDMASMTLNGAGSHTLKIYEGDDTMNDLSAGSGVIMPTDFDTFHLTAHQPAAFIATPILKRYEGNPFVAEPPDAMARLYYIYGGFWKAKIASPAQVGDTIYESTNQSPITTSLDVDLAVDDYMFFRPTQSEFVLLQFGDLLVFDENQLTAIWPVFQQTG